MMKPGDMGLGEFVSEVAQAGYQAVEIWSRDETLDELLGLCKKHGLQFCSMAGHDGIGSGLNDVSQHDRIEAELRESLDVAGSNGIPGIICFAGELKEGLSATEAADAAAAGLKRVAPYAEKAGVNLNLELLNSKVDHKGYQADNTAWGVSVCRKVGSPKVKLLYDIYHMQIMEGNIIRTIRDNIEWIGHFHTAGVPGRNDPDDSQEINYRGVATAIAGTEYGGYVGHEYIPKEDVIESIRKTYSLFDV
jgi:hydroxypyruvate isomerase